MNSLFDTRRYLIPFRTGLLPQIFCDTLVLGSGVAGLRAAIAAADSGEVIVCTKDEISTTNTSWAQGGIAAVLPDLPNEIDDTIEAHITDTLTAGVGMCDPEAVKLVCTQGPALVNQLIEWGASFDKDSSNHLSAGREGGHNANRIYHAGGDATGKEIQRALTSTASNHDSIRLFDHCFAIDLLTPSNDPGAPVLGAITWHPKHGLQVIWARTTILACGGAGQVYRETSNPPIATGDGIAMAYRAGASLQDMEFVQFHPTTLYIPGAPRSLISEAVRGEGAHLLDDSGNRFMPAIHELAELAPRDVVSRAISQKLAIQGGKHVWLDCRHIPNFQSRFPSIWKTLHSFGIDPTTDTIPVHPAAHYQIGGVRTDLTTATDVPNLYAIGETSCTGLHGANRLASNSLLEGLVMGAIAGKIAADRARAANSPTSPATVISSIQPSSHAELDLTDVRSSLRSTMWYNAGISRTRTKLADACDMFDLWGRYTLDKVFDTPDGWEVQNLLFTAKLIARAALNRPNSVGTHWIQAEADQPLESEPIDSQLHASWSRNATEPTYHSVQDSPDALTMSPEPDTDPSRISR
ncbi:MAG: L-aspartate oxidase [Phycisphaerales bacterium]